MGLKKFALCADGNDGAGTCATGGLVVAALDAGDGCGGGTGVCVSGSWDGLNAGGRGGGDGFKKAGCGSSAVT